MRQKPLPQQRLARTIKKGLLLCVAGLWCAAGLWCTEKASAAQNTAKIHQKGQDNHLDLTQAGQDNRLDLAQTGDGNTLVIQQEEEEGAFNSLVIRQQGDGNDLGTIRQDGVDNAIHLQVHGDDNRFTGHDALPETGVTQSGEGNTFSWDHDGRGSVADPWTIRQVGQRNTLTATSAGDEADLVLNLKQQGDDNRADLSLTFDAPGARLEVDLNQTGQGNLGRIDMEGEILTGLIGQTGDQNQGYLRIQGTDNQAAILQEGNDNTASLSILAGTGNEGRIEQYGDAHRAVLIQSGQNNDGLIQQYGTPKDITVTQFGDGRYAHVLQED